MIRYTPADYAGIELLLPDGSLWHYDPDFSGGSTEGIVDITSKIQYGIDLGIGELAGGPGSYSTPGGRAGPSGIPCALSGYMERLAVHIIEQAP